jgi:hypothetical protein
MYIENLEHRYILARFTYAMAHPIISDIDYDELHKYIVKQGILSEYTGRPWSDDPVPLELLTKYDLFDSEMMRANRSGGAAKGGRVTTSSIESVTLFSEVIRRYSGMNHKYNLSTKQDGWNAQVLYSNGRLTGIETRGRAGEPTVFEGVPSGVPKDITLNDSVVVVGEMTLSTPNFYEVQRRLGESRRSQRGAVSTAIAHKFFDLLTFSAFSIWVNNELLLVEPTYDFLTEWGFNLPEKYGWVNNFQELEGLIKAWSAQKSMLELPSDGLVLRDTKTNAMAALRVEGWAQGLYKSYVAGYEESYSNQYISQLVKIYPVDSKDATHKTVSTTNIARLIRYNLMPGAPIAFVLASDSVADLDETNTQLLHTEWEGRWEEYAGLVKEGLL